MRSICKKGSVTLVAVLALCALAAASASASQWYVGGKKLTKYHNTTFGNLAETVKVEENIVLSVPSVKLTITCKEAKVTGEPTIRGIDYMYMGFLSFRSCKTTEPATGCELKTGIGVASGVEGAAAAEGTAPEDKLLLAPTLNEDLNEFWLNEEENCSLREGSFQQFMKGQITFSMPKGREEAVEQTIVGQGAKESPSELTFLPKEHPAYLTGKFKIKLASGKAWSFH